jgi:tripartite-type tricarboxylate transporter receptor subunit TctC
MALPFVMKVPFDTVADFKADRHDRHQHGAALRAAQSPAGTVAEFVAYADKSRQAQLPQLGQRHRRAPAARAAQDQVRPRRHLDLLQGAAAGVQDLLANRLDLAMVSTTLVMQHVKAGRLKALAWSARSACPSCPTSRPWPSRASATSRLRYVAAALRSQKDLPAPIVERLKPGGAPPPSPTPGYAQSVWRRR